MVHKNEKRSFSVYSTADDETKSKLPKIQLEKNIINKENNTLRRIKSEQSHHLWSNMINKTIDKTYKCSIDFLTAHPSITKKMRSILFDWLIEVCEVYHLHRETYHLSIAYIDHYLLKKNNFTKTKFQLLGITALFVASKIEEIYPPHLSDFSYITDNNCSEESILDMELDLMNTLNWYLNPITSISWLSIYLQADNELKSNLKSQVLQSSKLTNVHRSNDFLQIYFLAVRLLDLCSLDIEYNQFSKHILAASAILFYKPTCSIHKIFGFIDEMNSCQKWMKPFYDVLSKTSINSTFRSTSNISNDEIYSIQTHNISIDLLENVYEKRLTSIQSISGPFRNLLNQI